MNPRENRIDPDHTENAGAQYHNDGRHHGFIQAAGGCNRTVHKSGNAVGESHDPDTLHSGIDHNGLCGKESQKLSSEHKKQSPENQADAKGIRKADKVAFLYAVNLSGSVVLAHEACAGHIEGCHGIINHRIRIRSSGVSLDHQRIKGVDACLNEQVGNRKDGILQPRRDSQKQNALCHIGIRADLLQMKRIAVLHSGQCMQNQRRRHTLGNGAGQGNTHDAEAADNHKEQVEDNIQRTCNGKINQWLFRLSDGTEHRIAEVIQRECRHTEKIHPKIDNGTGQQIRLGIQKPKKRR